MFLVFYHVLFFSAPFNFVGPAAMTRHSDSILRFWIEQSTQIWLKTQNYKLVLQKQSCVKNNPVISVNKAYWWLKKWCGSILVRFLLSLLHQVGLNLTQQNINVSHSRTHKARRKCHILFISSGNPISRHYETWTLLADGYGDASRPTRKSQPGHRTAAAISSEQTGSGCSAWLMSDGYLLSLGGLLLPAGHSCISHRTAPS